MSNVKGKIDGNNKKIFETLRLQKQNHATVWKKKIVQWEKWRRKRNVSQIIKNILILKNRNNTKLSTEYWKLENKKLHPWISWSIEGKYKSCNPNSRRCRLCLHEKLEIVDDSREILAIKQTLRSKTYQTFW